MKNVQMSKFICCTESLGTIPLGPSPGYASGFLHFLQTPPKNTPEKITLKFLDDQWPSALMISLDLILTLILTITLTLTPPNDKKARDERHRSSLGIIHILRNQFLADFYPPPQSKCLFSYNI